MEARVQYHYAASVMVEKNRLMLMVESISKSSTGVLADLTSKAAMKVLHVDDDLNYLEVAEQCLKMQGRFRVDTARSAEEAMEKMKKETYDAIISDYQMPGKNGLEFLKELREKGNNIPFIIFTGKGREEIAIKALNLGADRYFNKHGEPETVYGELVHGTCQAVEKKRAIDALHESERQSRTLLENLPQKIFIKDRNSVYISCNENYARDLEIKAEEIKGKVDFDFYPKELAEKYRADDKRIMASGNIEDIEEEYIQDGQSRYVHTVKTPVKDENGKIVGILGIFWDITERKKAEELAHASEERYRSYINLAGQLGWTTNANGEVEEDIPTWRKFTGQSYEEVKGWGWTKALHPDDLEHTTQTWERAVEAKSAYEVEYRIRRYDGVYRYFLARGVPVIKEDGSIREWVGTCIDITERKQWEDALRDAKEKWGSLTENTDDIVMIVDGNGVIQYINRTIPPYTPEETVGKTIHEYVPKEQHNVFEKSLREVFKTGKPDSYEVSSSIPKIGTMWFSTKIVPIKHDGKVSSAVLISSNITDRKKAEEELRNSKERLKETNKKLEVTNEKLYVVGSLTGHDVRNKLAAVTGNTYLLRQRLAENPKELEKLKGIEAAVQQVVKIFEFAGIYEKLGVEQPTYLDAKKVLDEAASLFSDLKGVRIVNDCTGLTVLADSLLRQAFYNMIDNSLKYGETIKQIRVYYKMSSGDKLDLVYEDDGVGIPSDMRDNLFKEGVGKGTGYGLFMIKRICEVYGWNIQVTGIQRKGVEFVITIPKTNPSGKENYLLQGKR